MFWTDLIPENIAVSKKAHHIGVYKIEGDFKVKVGVIDLRTLENDMSGVSYKFGVLSDTLLNVNGATDAENTRNLDNFQNAINFFNDKEKVKFACVCGNMAVASNKSYEQYYKVPVFCAKGNKDFMQSNEVWWNKTMPAKNTKYKKIIYQDKKNTCNFYFIHDNSVFAFLSSDSVNGGVYLEDNLRWLHGVLDENRNKKCFVFLHSPIFNKAGNIYPKYYELYGLNGLVYYGTDFDTYQKLRRLIEYYKNTVWFTGQTNYSLEAQVHSKTENVEYDKDGASNVAYNIHVPGCSYCNDVIESDTTQELSKNTDVSQGFIVTVYKNYLVINGITFKENGEFVNRYNPIGTYKLKTELVTVKSNMDLLNTVIDDIN